MNAVNRKQRPNPTLKMRKYFTLLLFSSFATQAHIPLLNIQDNGIGNWEKEVFSNETAYEIEEINGVPAVRAKSNNAASGLVLKKRIDLLQTPYINWSWKVAEKLPSLDEQSKQGDDYAARIYIVKDGDIMFWNMRVLNYVWSSSQDTGASWDNAYAGSTVKMVALQGKESQANHWYHERRNIYKDMIKQFGDKGTDVANQKAYRYVDAIAIMTDTDNSGGKAESYYGDIWMSSQ